MQFYCSKNACDPIEYTLKGQLIEPAGLSFTELPRRQEHATCAKNSSPVKPSKLLLHPKRIILKVSCTV